MSTFPWSDTGIDGTEVVKQKGIIEAREWIEVSALTEMIWLAHDITW